MKRLVRLACSVLFGAGIAAMVGCSHMPGGVAPSNIPLDGREYEEIGLVNTTDSRVLLFGLIPISGSNSIRNAMRACIIGKRADALIDITVESYSQFWILFTRDVIKVEGVAIRFKRDKSTK